VATLCAEGLDLVQCVTQFNDPVDVSYEGVRPVFNYKLFHQSRFGYIKDTLPFTEHESQSC
jgi:hypothetical protein